MSSAGAPDFPSLQPPEGACDCHVHVFGPLSRHPLATGAAYTPGVAEPQSAAAMLAVLGLSRIVLVQPSAYGSDNSCLLEGLRFFGECGRGVAVAPETISDAWLADLHDQGVRGLRLNFGGPGAPLATGDLSAAVRTLAAAIAGSRWCVQLHAPAAAIVGARAALERVAAPIVIDHFGYALADAEARAATTALLEAGAGYLKLSAPYRNAPYEAGAAARWIEALVDRNAERLLWGSDWPHTPPHGAAAPKDANVGFRDLDTQAQLRQALEWLPTDALRQKVLVDNPAQLFGF